MRKICRIVLALALLLLVLLSVEADAATVIDSGFCGEFGENLTWLLEADGTLTISGAGHMDSYSGGLGTTDTYPSPWRAYSALIQNVIIEEGVQSIGCGAFKDCVKICGIDIPEGVCFIGQYAFQNCSALADVTIPESVTECGFWAFYGCNSLKNVYYSGTLRQWCDISFGSAVNRSEANPMTYAKVLYIGGQRLAGEVVIPEGVTSIPKNTFRNIELTTMTLPASFADAENVDWPTSLTAIYVDGQNEKYSAESGILYNKSKTLLIHAPNGIRGSITLPDTLTYIADHAFRSREGLAGVSIPTSVTGIGEGAFTGCVGLSWILIPDSVTAIGSNAFNREDSAECYLEHVLYAGTEEQWSRIDIGPNNDDFCAVTRHNNCSGDEITDGICRVCPASCSHEWITGDIIKEPTCDKLGQRELICKHCGFTEVELLDRTEDHSYAAWEQVSGERHSHSCTVCGETETAAHQWDAGKVSQAPTCGAKGTMVYTCRDCGATKTASIAKLTEHPYDEGTVTKEPTCASSGERCYTCTVCGKTRKESIPKLSEHSFDEGKVTKAPTCAKPGEILYTCTICNKTNKETLEKLSTHSFDAGKVSKEPTCGADGEKTYTCTVCKQTKKERIEKLSDHSFGKGTVTKAPTCKEPGEKTYTCSTCGETQSVVIEKTDQHMPGPPATATDAQLCLNCGMILAPANGDPASTVVTTTAPPYSAQPTTSPQITPSDPHSTDEDPQGTATTHGQTNPVPTEPENTGYPVTLPGEGTVNATPVAAMIFGMCFILMFGIFGVVLLIKRDK